MEHISVIPQKLKDLSFFVVAAAGGYWVGTKVYGSYQKYIVQQKEQKILEKWKNSPKDVVIIHTLPRGKTVPSNSPFVLKLETYLRMTNISPYEMDFESPWSPDKGKTPWITLNGEHLADSQLIIEFLAQKFNKSVGASYSKEQQAIARAVRIMMDEHFYWGLGLWRYVYSGGKGLTEIFDMPPAAVEAFYKTANVRVKSNAWSQGTGRHSQEIVVEIMKKNLQAVSEILGTKKFLLGDDPCTEDCSVFGFIAQILWCHPESPYEKFITENCSNLEQYAIRMKETFWPDWNDCLAGARSRSQRLLAEAT